jgi:ankyrin repeat protein
MSAQQRDCIEIVTISTSSSTRYYAEDSTFKLRQYETFTWAWNVDWISMVQMESSSRQLAVRKYLSTSNIDATFYPTDQRPIVLGAGHECAMLPLYFTVSLLNNTTESNSNTAYKWLKGLPESVVSEIMRSLPELIVDALRERVFIASIEAGDAEVVQNMLASNVNPREKTRLNERDRSVLVYPFEIAMYHGHFTVAKRIILQMCRGATILQKNDLLDKLLCWEENKRPRSGSNSNPEYKLTYPELADLLCVALTEGAVPDGRCIAAVNGDFDLAKRILDTRTDGLGTWLNAGLFEACLCQPKYGKSFVPERLAESVMFYIFREKQHELPTGDQEFRIVILQGLRCAVESRRIWATEIIIHAIINLGYSLIDEGDPKGTIADALIQACHNADWPLAISLVPRLNTPENEQVRRADTSSTQTIRSKDRSVYDLYKAIDENDLELVCEILEADIDGVLQDDLDLRESFEDAAGLGRDEIFIAILPRLQSVYDQWIGIDVLLAYGRTATVSAVLLRNPEWTTALDAATRLGDFGPLDDILYSKYLKVPYAGDFEEVEAFDRHQLSFRVVAYYAIETVDYGLYQWLVESGMDSDEFISTCDESYVSFLSKRAITNGSFERGLQPNSWSLCIYPSIFSIAAEQDNLPWIQFLLTQGADTRDSMALLRAVKYRAKATTIQMLLETAGGRKYCNNRPYGSAALRKAIRYRDLDMIDLLSKNVDIDTIESSTEELDRRKKVTPTNPLGEAILMRDLEIVRILLDKGANANTYVSYNGWITGDGTNTSQSWLPRVSPLLAAIDMQSLPIVQLLVEHGAEVDYKRKHGISRTPLQRAAENGEFDIVRYLVAQGALVDTRPVYSGATALQLAAMSGYVGIATFLLEHGADPNYPPAEGAGRTAFEAAAEWARIDMMSLLMQAGVQLEMEVGDPPESQFERAQRFAEKNGFPASKRYVRFLSTQTPEMRSAEDARNLGLLQSPMYPTSPILPPASPL